VNINLINKLILGTVQFGIDYGINNVAGQTAPDEIERILSVCKEYEIPKLDTSQAYGNSEQILGRLTDDKFRIISKYANENLTVEKAFNDSLKRLNKGSLYGYLVHHLDSFRKQPAIWEQMIVLKNSKLVEKIGFSIYMTEELEYLLAKNIDFDLIQFPYNIFDRSFEPYFEELKRKNIEIHVRSVFLQGLFFKTPDDLPEKLSSLSPYLKNVASFCKGKDISIEELALNTAIHNKYIDGVLIGVDNHAQLLRNIKSILPEYTFDMKDFVDSIIIKEKDLLKPINWN
jgi:aryl-alcohol dehydrogenase-like predicted oxidoreductase